MRADGSCLCQHMELPPSVSATRVGTGDGWLPGGGSATPVDFGALWPRGGQRDDTNSVTVSERENTQGWRAERLSCRRSPL